MLAAGRDVVIGPMGMCDAWEAAGIEAASYPDPWSKAEIASLLWAATPGVVAVEGSRVLGYALYFLRPGGLFILRLAVAPERRRRGTGAALVEALAARTGRWGGAPRILCYPRESNLPGLTFLKACGFRAERVVNGYWEDTGEDAYEMVRPVTVVRPVPGGPGRWPGA